MQELMLQIKENKAKEDLVSIAQIQDLEAAIATTQSEIANLTVKFTQHRP